MKLKTIGLAFLIFAAALILYTVSLIAQRLNEASRSDGYNIRVRNITYGEAER
jgi:hypothetical protein